MKLNFDFDLKNFEGKAFQGDAHAGKVLANFLSQYNKGNAMKLWDWAQKWWNKQAVEIDETDSKVLEGIIETTEVLPVVTKAQLLEQIEKARNKEKK